jgi:hypothetical protein
MTFRRGSFFPAPAQPEFVNLKLGSGTRLTDICERSARLVAAGVEMMSPMQKAERAGPAVI